MLCFYLIQPNLIRAAESRKRLIYFNAWSNFGTFASSLLHHFRSPALVVRECNQNLWLLFLVSSLCPSSAMQEDRDRLKDWN